MSRFPACCLLVALSGGLACLPARAAPSVTLADLATAGPPSGETFELHGLQRGAAAPTWLRLRPLAVFERGARIVLAGPDGERELPLPPLRHFIGSEQGDEGRQVYLSIAGDGSVRGWLKSGDTIEAIARPPGMDPEAAIDLVRVDWHGPDAPEQRFRCGNDQLPDVPPPVEGDVSEAMPPGSSGAPRGGSGVKIARIAIETDHQYLALFGGDIAQAVRYAADLIGFASATYRNEVGYGLGITYLRLWTGGTSPWLQNSSGCLLYEFGKHWNDNMGAVQRTVAHLLSGRNTNSGIAWVGVLCRGGFNYQVTGCGALDGNSNYGGGYGVTAGIDGNFNPAAPQGVWDLVATSHEIGHNFNSPHTHCYQNLGGSPSAVDQCYVQSGSNCYAGATSLPGPQGQGSGTIMSYCHLLPGGLGNISFSFGQGHPYGVLPGRVPMRMAAHAQSTDSQNPGCFLVDDLFANGFQP